MSKSWFAAKCVIRHNESVSRRQIYEERVVLLRAASFDEAIADAEKNAKLYCDGDDGCEFTGYVDVYELYDERVGPKSELYSSMRTSSLNPEDYLDRFYPDRPEDCAKEGEAHRWYLKTDKTNGCYHCNVVSEIQTD